MKTVSYFNSYIGHCITKYSVDSTRLSLNEWLVEKNINIKVIFPSIAEGRDMLGLELPDDECERVQLILTIT